MVSKSTDSTLKCLGLNSESTTSWLSFLICELDGRLVQSFICWWPNVIRNSGFFSDLRKVKQCTKLIVCNEVWSSPLKSNTNIPLAKPMREHVFTPTEMKTDYEQPTSPRSSLPVMSLSPYEFHQTSSKNHIWFSEHFLFWNCKGKGWSTSSNS